MASRRLPLAHVPNAVNSPMRNVPAVNGKRTRTLVAENEFGQPPTKKQVVELQDNEENIDPRRRNGLPVTVIYDKLDSPFTKRGTQTQPTAFETRLTASRERRPTSQQRNDRMPKQQAENLAGIRQWQRHYRRLFPDMVFYFESVPDDVRRRTLRQIHALGGREEKFFSRAVTHVVTTRIIPPEPSSSGPDETDKFEDKHDAAPAKTAPAGTLDQNRSTNLLEANLQRRSQLQHASVQSGLETRKLQAHNSDILSKARELGIKIWALEKLHRVLTTMLETDTGDQLPDQRGHGTSRVAVRNATQDADLEQLLRHEKVKGPADRDMTVATQDMVTLRGCFMYVHDMDEKTKPVMVRDYAKPQNKELGKWPQFRLSGPGRCPFIEDVGHAKKLQQQEWEAQRERDAQAAKDLAQRRSTRTGSLLQAVPSPALKECEANLRRSPRKLTQVSKPLDPPCAPPARRQSSTDVLPPLFNSAQANMRGLPRTIRGEPVASGVQRSNVTSAIRSQAVSSAAISSTAPGFHRRVGDTKEMALLKRKMLASNGSTIPSSYVNDVRAAINDDQAPPPRAAKQKAQKTLGVVQEDGEMAARAESGVPRKNKAVEKEAKPGYCENCHDKYDDFDEHIGSRKHRKFAVTQENWKELDSLLGLLKRPHKSQSSH